MFREWYLICDRKYGSALWVFIGIWKDKGDMRNGNGGWSCMWLYLYWKYGVLLRSCFLASGCQLDVISKMIVSYKPFSSGMSRRLISQSLEVVSYGRKGFRITHLVSWTQILFTPTQQKYYFISKSIIFPTKLIWKSRITCILSTFSIEALTPLTLRHCWPTVTSVKLKVLRWAFAPHTAGSIVSKKSFSIIWECIYNI